MPGRAIALVGIVLGSLFAFAGLVTIGTQLPMRLAWEKAEASYQGTIYSDDYGNRSRIYSPPLRRYTCTLKDGKQKYVYFQSLDKDPSVTIYFHHTPESDRDPNVHEKNWCRVGPVHVLTVVGVVMLVLGGSALVFGLIMRRRSPAPPAPPPLPPPF